MAIEKGEKEIGDFDWGKSEGLHAGFAVGFALGQDLEINDKEILAILNALKKRIYEERILPYSFRACQKKKEPQPVAEGQGS